MKTKTNKDITDELTDIELETFKALTLRLLCEEAQDYVAHEISILEDEPKTIAGAIEIATFKQFLKLPPLELISTLYCQGRFDGLNVEGLAKFASDMDWI